MDTRTTEEIHNAMLGDISDEYEKVEGSFIYLATKPVAQQLRVVEQNLIDMNSKLDIENLRGNELEDRVYDRTGIERKQATYATCDLTVEGNGDVNVGDLFESESGVQFEATETVTIATSGIVNVRCVQPGVIGNIPSGKINMIPVTLDGITSCVNNNPSSGGYGVEADADLLERYYERIRTPSTSGNKYHYINWAKEVSGVGDAKVFPLWNGSNTVKIVIIDSNKQAASETLVADVQSYIDPNSSGLGEGKAPIGAVCTVASAAEKAINVSFSATLEQGYTHETVIQNATENISEFLKSIAFSLDYVSYTKIGSIILDTTGIKDYTNLTINDGISNIDIADVEVAIIGGVTIV